MKRRARPNRLGVVLGPVAVRAALAIAAVASTARAAGVVGTGTQAGCTDVALNAALSGGGAVTFNCGGPATIDISRGTGTKTIAVDTIVDGGGLITISGGNAVQVFNVESGVALTVRNATIADGTADQNGGGISNAGVLTVTDCIFSANRTNLNQPGNGGAIYSSGMLTVTDCTFSANTAAFGGGISGAGTVTITNSTFTGNASSNGGALACAGAATVSNCTFSANTAGGRNGGGAFSLGGGAIVHGTGTLSIANCTFAGNAAAIGGGGILNIGGTVTVTNSTFSADDAPLGGGVFDVGGSAVLANSIVADGCFGVTDGGHNLDSGTSCKFSAANGSLSSTDPRLDPAGLQPHGGPTHTVALCTAAGMPAGCTAASPAIGAGDQAICAAAPVDDLDQRGFARPGTGQTTCGMGAYEAGAMPSETCIGDCDTSGVIDISDLVLGVDIALGLQPVDAYPAFENAHGMVDIAQLIKGVDNALVGCAG